MLEIVPTTLAEANAFVEQHHRHHMPVVGHIASLACTEGERVAGVAIIGRPVARGNQDGFTAEVTRLCTDGTQNACSMLYAASWRACRALGYRRLITYTLASEGGVSLRAAGWRIVGEVKGRSWHTPSRPRVVKNPAQLEMKTCWEVAA
jgi:L-amino acid N-acyltransferase YncA